MPEKCSLFDHCFQAADKVVYMYVHIRKTYVRRRRGLARARCGGMCCRLGTWSVVIADDARQCKRIKAYDQPHAYAHLQPLRYLLALVASDRRAW